MTTATKFREKLPWYGWLLALLVLPVVLLVVAIPLGILGLFSIPYYFVFPDHHRHMWDFEGTAHQRARLAEWRSLYSRLGFFGRVRRAITRRASRALWRRRASNAA